MIKKYKFIILLGLLNLFIVSCGSVQEALDPKRKNNSEEFLVKKKSPLSIPPGFYELPIPKNNNKNNQDQIKDIELLITENNKGKKEISDTKSSDSDFEKLILDKIKNN
jgi:hypothetical protein